MDDFFLNVVEEVADFLFWVEMSSGIGWQLLERRGFFGDGLPASFLDFRGHYFIYESKFIKVYCSYK
jgi:hypothetical protein